MTSKKVFLAPSSFIAFIDRAHPMHSQAEAFFRFFATEQYILFTDYPTIMEAYRIIFSTISPSLAKDFLRTMSITSMNIMYPEDSDAKAALKALITYQSSDLTYNNALMFVPVCMYVFLRHLF